MNTATEGIAQLSPLMPGNVFTIAHSVYAASQCTVSGPGNNNKKKKKSTGSKRENLHRDEVWERNGARREGGREMWVEVCATK